MHLWHRAPLWGFDEGLEDLNCSREQMKEAVNNTFEIYLSESKSPSSQPFTNLVGIPDTSCSCISLS